MNGTKYGTCKCDMNAEEPKVEKLHIFDTYDEAYEDYMNRVKDEMPGYFPSNLYLVFIEEENNRIVQFERLSWDIKCKIAKLSKKDIEKMKNV